MPSLIIPGLNVCMSSGDLGFIHTHIGETATCLTISHPILSCSMASIFSARAITLFIISFSSSVRSGLSLCHRSHIRGTQVKQRRVQRRVGRLIERVNNTRTLWQSRLPRMHASLLVVGPPAIRGAAHHRVRHAALSRSAGGQKDGEGWIRREIVK